MIRALILFSLATVCESQPNSTVTGERRLWHPIAVTFEGPATSEDASPNPFRDYRLNVAFTHSASGTVHRVPGYYAADGNAANSAAKSGNNWRVLFTPDREGEWRYVASFRGGPDVAISPEPQAGRPASFDGASGIIRIVKSSEAGAGFLGKGLLRYVGEHYLKHAGSGEYFLKGGADSPENFLAYFEFDGTFDTDAHHQDSKSRDGRFLHRYEPHARDWKPGDPTWQGGKGKNIIGALNYLAGKGVNSVYFLTYNLDGGDGKDTWMWASPDVRDRFDCSKLDQWEIVFSHMDRLGIQLHVVTQETENDRKLGGSPGLNPIRKLYYRELVARFSHHLAVIWNQGEENNTPDPDRKAIARYIRELDPYDHPITVHTHNNKAPDFYSGLLGDPFFEASSVQGDMKNYNRDAIALRERTAKAGRPWAIFGDEQPSADIGVLPDNVDPAHDVPRKQALWGNLMGGGSGVEWYFGYGHPHMDLNCEDFRSRDRMWDQTRHALSFFHEHLPFWRMAPFNTLAKGVPAYLLAKPGDVYAAYLPEVGAVALHLEPGWYSVHWYDPRNGGNLETGSVRFVDGAGLTDLGKPPAGIGEDWVVLVRRTK